MRGRNERYKLCCVWTILLFMLTAATLQAATISEALWIRKASP